MLAETTDTTVMVALIGIITLMIGGFGLLGRTALRAFLGEKLDGNGGAWNRLVVSIQGLNLRMEAMEHKQSETVEMLKDMVPEQERDVAS